MPPIFSSIPTTRKDISFSSPSTNTSMVNLSPTSYPGMSRFSGLAISYPRRTTALSLLVRYLPSSMSHPVIISK